MCINLVLSAVVFRPFSLVATNKTSAKTANEHKSVTIPPGFPDPSKLPSKFLQFKLTYRSFDSTATEKQNALTSEAVINKALKFLTMLKLITKFLNNILSLQFSLCSHQICFYLWES
jgi:hypothetical protein